MDETARFKLTVLNRDTDKFEADSYKFSDLDRHLIDRLLAYAVEHHRHTGEPPAAAVYAPPALEPAGGGRLPPGRAIYYRYGVVDQTGAEGSASAVASITTPLQIETPLPPGFELDSGDLIPGTYQYGVSAWEGNHTSETMMSSPVSATVAGGGGVVVYFPALPAGADGFNVYRQGPTDTHFARVASFHRGVIGYIDIGDTTDPLHGQPTANTTNLDNAVFVVAPIELGTEYNRLRIYRTTDPADWTNSLVGTTTNSFLVDVGSAGLPGSPQPLVARHGTPPRIDLGTETVGMLPTGRITTPATVTFAYPGEVSPGPGKRFWLCDYWEGKVMAISANLGRNRIATAPITFEVHRSAWDWDLNDDLWELLDTVEIPAGENGTYLQLPADLPESLIYQPGKLRVDIVSAPAGHADNSDMLVNIHMMVRAGSWNRTEDWEGA